MNLLDFVRRNEFLTKVFPNGLEESVYIGQIVFDVEGRLSIKIHTHQKPAVDVGKWGAWGKDFNVLVIELNGTGCDDINIVNWKKASYAKLNIVCEKGKKFISQQGDDWSVNIEFDDFIFQGFSNYIDGDKD